MKTFSFFLALMVLSGVIPEDISANGEDQSGDYYNRVLVNPAGAAISGRFRVPVHYARVPLDMGSFGYFLRNLPLKSHGSMVHYFNGYVKKNSGIYAAVVDMDIGREDLLQCADAVMLLRGEYLYARGDYDRIHFNLLKDGKPRYYKDWADRGHSYRSFRKYMDHIFAYANTRSLRRELVKADMSGLKAGDIFIQTGNPYGHAVLVADVAIDSRTKNKIFLLAQSYMPAQDIQILVNPGDSGISPWYRSDFEGPLHTPEWTFYKNNLHRFRD